MPWCVIKSCPNWHKKSRDPKVKYLRFPDNNFELLEKWKNFCDITYYNSKKTRICSLHFTTDSFETKPLHLSSSGENSLQLKSTAIPTLHLSLTNNEKRQNKRKALMVSETPNEISSKKFKENSLKLGQLLNDVHKPFPCQEAHPELEIDKLHNNIQKIDVVSKTDVNHISMENEVLKNEIIKLSEKLAAGERFVESKIRKKVFEVLAPLLHIRDIRNFLHPGEEFPKWTKDDLTAAVALRCILPKNHKNHSHMNNSKLLAYKKQIAEFNLKPGVIMELLPHIDERHKDFLPHEKLGFLHLQEINIAPNIFCNEKVYYGTLHGLCRKWKNLTYFNYHQPFSAEIFNEVIEKIQIINHVVVAIFTDLPTAHVYNYFSVGISDDKKRYFIHPIYDNLKVFAFVDPFELLKELRNYFLDFGFYYKDQILDKQCLEELLMLDANEVKVANKLEQKHLEMEGADRHGVTLALQLFSNTTAECIRWCGSNGLLASEYWNECADFIKTVNDWFDIFNINNKHEKKSSGIYGVDTKTQNKVLDKMSSYMANIRIENHLNLLPVQNYIILNNLSLKEFLPYIQSQYNKIEKISFCFH